jgi:hypothetical protein
MSKSNDKSSNNSNSNIIIHNRSSNKGIEKLRVKRRVIFRSLFLVWLINTLVKAAAGFLMKPQIDPGKILAAKSRAVIMRMCHPGNSLVVTTN